MITIATLDSSQVAEPTRNGASFANVTDTQTINDGIIVHTEQDRDTTAPNSVGSMHGSSNASADTPVLTSDASAVSLR